MTSFLVRLIIQGWPSHYISHAYIDSLKFMFKWPDLILIWTAPLQFLQSNFLINLFSRLAISTRDWTAPREGCLLDCWRWRPYCCCRYSWQCLQLGRKRLRPARTFQYAGPSNRHWRLPLLAYSKNSWLAKQHKNRSDSLWRCSYSCFDKWWQALLLGWRWMRLTWPSGHGFNAKRWGWVSLLTKT